MATKPKPCNSYEVIANKSAKALLNEVCTQHRVYPKWDTEELQTVPPTLFRCVLTIPETDKWKNILTSEGQGGTKKEAEQSAALAMLPKVFTVEELLKMTPAGLGSSTGTSSSPVPVSPRKKISVDEDPVSDTDNDDISANPIGELSTLCDRNGLEPPIYKDSRKGGIGNTNIFTVCCSVGSTSCQSGRRLRKQDAKKVSAFRVLRDLKDKGYLLEAKKGGVTKAQTPLLVQTQSPRVRDGDVSSSQEESGKTYCKVTFALNGLKAASSNPNPSVDHQSTVSTSGENGDNSTTEENPRSSPDFDEASGASGGCQKRSADLLLDDGTGLSGTGAVDLTTNKRGAADGWEDEKEKEFLSILRAYGGAENYLKMTAVDLNIKYTFCAPFRISDTGDGKKMCVFVTLRFPDPIEFIKNKTMSFSGGGKTREEVRENASRQALIHLREMMMI